MFRIALTVGLMISLGAATVGQPPQVASLLQRIHGLPKGDARLNAILDLCEMHYNLNRDTLDKYAVESRELVIGIQDSLLQVRVGLANANNYFRWGWTDSCRSEVKRALASCPESNLKFRRYYFELLRLEGMSYASVGNYQVALDILYQLINKAQHYRDDRTVALNSNSVASVALARGDAQEALSWVNRALTASATLRDAAAIQVVCYINKASAFRLVGRADSASRYIKLALPLARADDNLYVLGVALRTHADIEREAGHTEAAEDALLEMIALRQHTGDEHQYVEDRIGLVNFYIETNQIHKAIDVCLIALRSGDTYSDPSGKETGQTYTNHPALRLQYYEVLAKCYKLQGDQVRYQRTLENIIAAKDTLYQINSAEAIAEIQTKYEVQQKENIIIQQELALAQRNNQILMVLGGLIIVLLTSVLFFNIYQRRHKVRIAKAEENERKRISTDLHDNLGAYAASIASNINHIKQPESDLQSVTALRELQLNANAMMTELNNTIWVLKHEDLSLTAISDRLKLMMQRLAPSYPHVTLDVNESIGHEHVLPSSQAFHLFRIIQEGINNALVHSGCKNVVVHIDAGETWEVRIEDDGRGMPVCGPESGIIGGNGLGNMRLRAEQCGWQIQWIAHEPGGTSVRIATTK